MSLTLEVAGRSDVGRVRPSNEDNLGYDQRLGIFVVCDGMGGHAAGEVASQIAVDTILAYFREHAPKVEDNAFLDDAPVGARLLAEAVKKANDAILEYAEEHKNTSGMGTTLVAARFSDGVFSIANVGDSRIYLFREGQLLQLTEDHSLVMEQVRRGMLTLEEARRSSAQNIITRALGTDESTLARSWRVSGAGRRHPTANHRRRIAPRRRPRDAQYSAATPVTGGGLPNPDRCGQ